MPPTGSNVSGPLDRVPCPSCGKPNNMRPIQEEQLLDTGSDYSCDGCGNLMTVVAIQQVTIVSVRRSPNRPRGGPPAAQPATTIGGGVLRKLLGRG